MILLRCFMLAGSLACYACAPAVASREVCYARAEAHAVARATSECDHWTTCVKHDAIMSELAASEKVCR